MRQTFELNQKKYCSWSLGEIHRVQLIEQAVELMGYLRKSASNDNAHVEQKDWTHVRHWFGYQRHDNPEVVRLINALAKSALGQFVNLYSPNMKLEHKEQKLEGGEISSLWTGAHALGAGPGQPAHPPRIQKQLQQIDRRCRAESQKVVWSGPSPQNKTSARSFGRESSWSFIQKAFLEA